ncbi:hypothetical protein FEM48_Zijuj09G0108800 [Ziziphus jujuba var. spinosa]|uniref:Retrotransposon Copia-like N-terminal domain-containing protein n=1 Tax=Ziziphus jujuba var. spinosa TaxID=714518 RepID=A0A978USK9_ZIZJJ|nr:hypothetical protein FEM48_Zijuj09G0108800 [Ziziphus jujuba var. spinosa]
MADSDPSLKLSSVPLNVFNFVSWSKAVTLSLGGKRKLGYLDGSLLCPKIDDAKFEDWLATNQLVRSWILNSMDPQINEIFTYSESAREVREAVTELAEEDKIFALLSSLKPDYETFRSNILMDAKLPTLATVCASIQQEEIHKRTMKVAELIQDAEKLESHALVTGKFDRKNFQVQKRRIILYTKERRNSSIVNIVVNLGIQKIDVGSCIHISN